MTDTETVRNEETGDEETDDAKAALPPLRLLAEDHEDLLIISAALQDAILTPADIRWESAARRLTITLRRFCWECGGTRVQAALQFGDVMAVMSRDLPRAPEIPLELLTMDFVPGEAPGGRIIMMFAGGGDLRVDVECTNAVLADISERWRARRAPTHGPMTEEDPA